MFCTECQSFTKNIRRDFSLVQYAKNSQLLDTGTYAKAELFKRLKRPKKKKNKDKQWSIKNEKQKHAKWNIYEVETRYT